MANRVQYGDLAFTGSTTTVTVESYTASKTWLRYSMRCDGTDNAWDDQVVARKASSTTITFQRRGNTGTVFIRWWLIECDEFTVQDIDDAGPLANTTYEDFSITSVTLSRTFLDASCRDSGDRDNTSSVRVRLFDSSTVRVETGTSVSADLEFFVQVVSIADGWNTLVQEVLIEDSTTDEDVSLGTSVDPDHAFVVGSAHLDTAATWDNAALHNIRLSAAGDEVELRRTTQTGMIVDATVYVVESDLFGVQHNSCTLGATDTSNTASFSAPSNSAFAFLLNGSYYNQSQHWVTTGAPDTSGHTLVPNYNYTSITAERAVAGGTATVEIMLVELLVPDTEGIYFKGIESNSVDDTSITISTPERTQDGDLLMAVIGTTDDNPDITFTTVPSGWTSAIARIEVGGATTSPPAFWVWYKIASSEGSSYTWTIDSATRGLFGSILTYSNVDATTPLDATPTSAAGNNATLDPASITTVTDDAWVVVVAFHDDDDGMPNGLCAGYAERLPVLTNLPGGVSNGGTVGICDVNAGTAGAEDPPSFTILTEEWGAITLALRPESLAVADNAPFFGCNF